MDDTATHCTFSHTGFGALQDPFFRLTEGDRVPALAIKLDGSEAVVPLQALAKLFGIVPGSPDGRMLSVIAEALRFVVCVRIGDVLPTEVTTGEASWQPSAYHVQVASARLQMQLVKWIGGTEDGADIQITSQMLVVSVDDPAIRPRVQEALRRAAEELGIEGGGPAVAKLIEGLAAELAYIEALRERLLGRVQALLRRLLKMLQGSGGQLSAGRRETLFQVVRLAGTGLAEISGRFDQVDAQTSEILGALRNLEQHRSFLRPNRDWLYSTQLAWDVELREWDTLAPGDVDDRIWKLIDRLYRFTAIRFMAVQEWQSLESSTAGRKPKALVW